MIKDARYPVHARLKTPLMSKLKALTATATYIIGAVTVHPPIGAAVLPVACWVSKKGTHVISKGRYADRSSWSLAGSDKPKEGKGVRGSPAMNQNSIKQP